MSCCETFRSIRGRSKILYRTKGILSNFSTTVTTETEERGTDGEVGVEYDTCFFSGGTTFLYIKYAYRSLEIRKKKNNKTETKKNQGPRRAVRIKLRDRLLQCTIRQSLIDRWPLLRE